MCNIGIQYAVSTKPQRPLYKIFSNLSLRIILEMSAGRAKADSELNFIMLKASFTTATLIIIRNVLNV